MHPAFVRFLKNVDRKFSCNKYVGIGDLVDWNAISFHEKDPQLPGAKEEFALAKKQVKKIHQAFPEVQYLMGNHSDLPGRKARTVGLIDETQVPFKKLWGLDGWTIHPRYADIKIDGVIYRHGDKGKGGQRIAALANAEKEHCSLVQGHLHAQFGIEFTANQERAIFGAQCGCGVMPNHPNMKYSRIYSARPILGTIVVINGEPQLVRMKL
jgi:hypothetical protein